VKYYSTKSKNVVFTGTAKPKGKYRGQDFVEIKAAEAKKIEGSLNKTPKADNAPSMTWEQAMAG